LFLAFSLLTPLFFFLILPVSKAEAGILSFTKEAQAQTPDANLQSNTQTVQLLEGFSSPSLNEATSPILAFEGDGALLPLIGPMGTPVDLGEEGLFDGQISVYVVREGDTVAAIAKMFGVSANTIIWANDLDPKGKLKVGDTLIILPITGVQYEIKKGDTLESIAKKFGGDVTEIRRFNGLAVDEKIIPGDFLIIPNGDMHLAAAPAKKSTTAPKTATNLKSIEPGFFIRPIGPGFQWRKSQGFHGPYNAIDIAAPTGTPIQAAAAGTVISAKGGGWNGGYGQIVIIAHDNGTQTLYAHLSKVSTSVGARVGQGETIGLVGSTGRSTGPHLHFEIRGAAARPILSALY
jgi:murein DD-endopeptidase MepM/ murein hydrolase activator NlpD